MRIDATETADGLIVTVGETRIDAMIAIPFKDRLRELAAGTGAARVVMDLSHVDFIDSSGLGAIVASMKALAPRPLELAGLTPTVAKLFRLTRMDSVFTIHPHPVPPAADGS